MSMQAVRVPIELELKNMQGAINTLKNALSNVSKNSGISTEINKDLDRVQKKFNELQAIAGRPFTKVSDLNSFQNQLLKLGDSVNIISDKFKGIQFKDIDLSKIQGAEATFKKLQAEVAAAEEKARNFTNVEFSKMAADPNALKGVIENFQNVFKGKAPVLDTSSFEKSFEVIKSKLAELIKAKDEYDAKMSTKKADFEQATTKYSNITKAEEDLKKIQAMSDQSGDSQRKALENFKANYAESAKSTGLTVEDYLKAYFGIDLKLFNEAKQTKDQIDAEIQRNLDSNAAGSFKKVKASASKNVVNAHEQMGATESKLNTINSELQVAQSAKDAFTGAQEGMAPGLKEQIAAAIQAKEALEAYQAQILQTVNATQNAKGAAGAFGDAIASTQGQIAQAENRLRMLNEQARKMDQFKSRMAMWFGFTRIMSTIRRVVNSAVTEIRELDKVMTQISVVTKMSQEDLWNQIDAYTAIAKQYGVATRGVYEVSQIYYQQGLQTADVMDLTSETLKMAKIASLDYATAADYMTVAVRGFKMEMSDAQVVTDVYSALAANTASSTEELATAMSKTASSAEAVGSSFESTSAMIATMIATTRESATNIGSAMKSIISRYGEMTADPTKLVDSEGEEMSLNRVDKALQSIGITLQTTNGQFRDFDDVILELAQKWDTVDRNTQRYIATIMAGNRQQSRFLALVGNYDEYARALDIAANAEDSGTLQTLKTMDSLETKIQGVKTAWEQFYNSMNIEGGMKKGLDLITNFLNKLSGMSKPAAFATIINIFKGLKTLISGAFSGITGVFQKLQGNAQSAINNLNKQLSALQKAQTINVEIEQAQAKIRTLIAEKKKLSRPESITVTNKQNPLGTSKPRPKEDNKQYSVIKQGEKPSLPTPKGGTSQPTKTETKVFRSAKTLSGTFTTTSDSAKKLKGSFESTEKATQKTQAQIDAYNKKLNKASGMAMVFGGILQTAGAALTTWAMTLEDKSTDKIEKSKLGVAGGGFLSSIGSGLQTGGSATMMTGNWIIGVIAGVAAMIPGLISGFSNLEDALNFETKERLALANSETETSKNKSTKEKGEFTSLEKSIKDVKVLAESRYDSAEAAQEYKEAMSNLAESYPELISYTDSTGEAILDAVAAEKKLTEARYDAAVAANQAAENELRSRKLKLQNFTEAKLNFEYGRYVQDRGSSEKETLDEALQKAYISTGLNSNAAAIRGVVGNNFDAYAELLSDFRKSENEADFLKTKEKLKEWIQEQGKDFDAIKFLNDTSEANRNVVVSKNKKIVQYEDLTKEDLFDKNNYYNAYKNLETLSETLGVSIEELTGINSEQWKTIAEQKGYKKSSNVERLFEGIKLAYSVIDNYVDETTDLIVSQSKEKSKTEMQEYILKKAKNSSDKNEKKMEDNLTFFSTIGGLMLDNLLDKDKYDTISDWENDLEDDNTEKDFDIAKENIYSSLSSLNGVFLEKLINLSDNVSNYKTLDSFIDEVDDFTQDEEILKAFTTHYEKTINSLKERAVSGIETYSSENSDLRELTSLFDKEGDNELLASYGDYVVSAVKLADEYYNNGLTAKAEILSNSVTDLFNSIGTQSDDIQRDIFSITEKIDWSSATSLDSAIDALKSYAASNKDVNLTDEIEALQNARDNLAFNLSTEIQMMTNAIKDGIEGMEKTISNQTKGMGLDDALSAFRTITAQEEYQNTGFNELIKYDATLKQWVFEQKGFAATISAQTKTIENSRSSAEKAFTELTSLQDTFGNLTDLDKSISEIDTSSEDFKWSEYDWNSLFDNTFDNNLKMLGLAQEQVQSYKASGSKKSFTEWLTEQVDLGKLEWDNAEQIYKAWGANIVNLLSAGIDIKKIMSGTDAGNQKSILTQIIAENYKKQDSNVTEEIALNYAKAVVDGIYQAIQEGDLSKLGEQIEITDEMSHEAATTPAELANKAIEELIGGLNTVLSAETVQYLKKIEGFVPTKYGINVDKNGAWILSTAEASADLLNLLLEVPGESLEEQNEYLAKAYEHLEKADDAAKRADLVDKTSVTFEDLSELATLREMTLNTLFDQDSGRIALSGLKYNDFTGEFDITNFDAYWDAVTGSLEKGTVEYLEAYSSWVADYLEKENMVKEEAQTQLDDLLDASLYEKINVAFLNAAVPNLENYLGEIENGMAVVDENTDFLGLLQKLEAMEASGEDVIEDSVGEIRDKITELIESWADAISAGLTGELGATEAEKLKAQFGLTDADFTETKKGLEISRQTAFELYEQIKKIAPLQAELIFDQLSESLAEASEGYEDVASVMGRIAEINKELANVPVDSSRREELERELAVAEEILRVRSQAPESFNFMDKELPTGMQGPENYWNSVGQAYQVMNEAASSGYMGIQDYVNIIRQMEAMALAAGQEFSIEGMNAAQLIEAGMNALSNIDGEGVKVNLENIGVDVLGGTEGMTSNFEKAIKEVAHGQVEMLGAAIQMLETIVAMEELGDIDIDKNNQIDLGEIFKIDENGNIRSFTTNYISNMSEIRANLEEAGIELNKVKIGTLSLDEILTTNFATWKNLGLSMEEHQQLINNLYQTVLNGDYDFNDLSSIFKTIASSLGQDFSFTSDKFTVTLTPTGEIFTIDWTSESIEQKVKEAGFQTVETAKAAVDTYIAGGELGELTLTKVLTLLGQLTYENGEYVYTDSNNKKHSLNNSNVTDQISQIEEQNTKDKISGQKEYSGKGKITPVTLQNGTQVNCLLEAEGNKATVRYNGQSYTVTGRTAGEAIALAKQWVREQALQSEDSTRTTSSMSVGETVEINGKLVTEIKYSDGTVVYKDEKGNTYSTKGEVADAAIEEEAQTKTTEKKAEIISAEAELEVSSVTEVKLAEGVQPEAGFKLTEKVKVAADAETLEITSVVNPTLSSDVADDITIKVPAGLDEDSVSKIERFNNALTGLSAVGAFEAGVTDTTSIPETALKNIILLKDALREIQKDPSIETTVKAKAAGVAFQNVRDLLALYGYDAQTANLIFSIIDENDTISSMQTKIDDLLTLEPKQIELVLTNPELLTQVSEGVEKTVTIKAQDENGNKLYDFEEVLTPEGERVEHRTHNTNGLDNFIGIDKTILDKTRTAAKAVTNNKSKKDNNSMNAFNFYESMKSFSGENSEGIIATSNAVSEAMAAIGSGVQPSSGTLEFLGYLKTILELSGSASGDWNPAGTLTESLQSLPEGKLEELNTLLGFLKQNENGSWEFNFSGLEETTFGTPNRGETNINGDSTNGPNRTETTEITSTETNTTSETANVSSEDSIVSGENVTVEGLKDSGGESDGSPSGTFNSSGQSGETQIEGVTYEGAIISLTPFVDAATTQAAESATALSAIGEEVSSAATSSGKEAASGVQQAFDDIKVPTPQIKVKYPSSVSIGVDYSISVTTASTGPGTVKGRISNVSAPGLNSYGMNSASGSLAKGNVSGKAFVSGTRRTLMGELGPELVVSGGRYYVVGQSGAEFVDLADDAIVFNHLQTQRLLKNGHAGTGKPVTNERNATSFATGNVGPAKASAKDTLAQLRQIRAMWQALIGASAEDLGSKAGYSGGGNGSGSGGEASKAVLGDLDRWYNLLRQIESLEKSITLEQAKRANMRDGRKYADSLEKELGMLRKQQEAYKKLAEYQKRYYDARMQEVNESEYGEFIFTYDENGLMQYRESEANADGTIDPTKLKGLDLLAALNETDENGVAKRDAQAQLDLLKAAGFDISILGTNADGSKAKTAEEKMQNFWDNIDGLMEEMDGIYDSYNEALIDSEENLSKINEILQEYIDNQLSVEQKLLQAIQDREQAEIDRLEKEKELLEEASQEYIDGLNEALSKEREMYDKNQNEEETSKLQRRLAILQRSGGSASEIKSLQDQIDSRLKDAYFQEQQDQIDAIQEASNNQIEKLQTQIDIMTETLEYQKENGLLWNEVYEMMQTWTPQEMLAFIEQYTQSYQENSALQNEQDSQETNTELGIYTAGRDREARDAAWKNYYDNLSGYSDEIKQANAAAAQEAFNSAYETGGLSAAQAAANEVFSNAATNPGGGSNDGNNDGDQGDTSDEPSPPTTRQNGSISGGSINVRASASSKSKSQGTISSGRSFDAVGYKDGWLKVENADVGGKKVSGYMKYDGYQKYYRGISVGSLPAFAKGGLVDFTGPAWVDGTKSKPEAFLSASDTAMLKSKIFSNSDGSLKSLVAALEKITNDTSHYSGEGNAAIIIENAQVNIQPGTISNDYDARRAGEMALEEMIKIARKTTNRVVSR